MSPPASPLDLADLPSFEGRWADMLDEEYHTTPSPKTWSNAVRVQEDTESRTDAPSWRSPPDDTGSWTVVERRPSKKQSDHHSDGRRGRRHRRKRLADGRDRRGHN